MTAKNYKPSQKLMAKAYVKYTRSQYIERKSLCTENYKQVPPVNFLTTSHIYIISPNFYKLSSPIDSMG